MHRSCTASSTNPRVRTHPFSLGMIRSKLTKISISTFVLSVILFPMGSPYAQERREEPMELSVVAVNPSSTKTQTVPIKMYLPQEVTPTDIFTLDGLEIEFDSDQSMYFLYKDDLVLEPSETQTFTVEIRDVWKIPQDRLDILSDQAHTVIERLQGSEFYDKAVELGEAIDNALATIATTQNDDTVSRRTHIGIYRNNLKILDQVKEDVNRLEKQLEIVFSLPKPDVLEKEELKTESPNDSTTWMIIFIIMLFIGMLAGVFFFTWQTQAHSTKRQISEARSKAFPKQEGTDEEESE